MTDKNAHIALNHALYEHGALVRQCGYTLDDLTMAAHALGQDRLAETLRDMSDALNKSFEQLNAAHGQSVHQNLMDAEQSTMNLMRGVLAGIGIGEKGQPTP